MLYTHQALVAYLLVALGSVTEYFQLLNEDIPKPTTLIHVLSAVFTVGVLESLRQDRPGIEPASFRLVHAGPRNTLYYLSWRCFLAYVASVLVCDAILLSILLATDRVLREVGGMSLRSIVPYWGWEGIQYPGRWGSAVVSLHLGGPFADMAETIYYALCRTFVPHLAGPRGWMPKPAGPLHVPVSPFFSPGLEVFHYALLWLPRMLYMLYTRDPPRDGASADGPRWGVCNGLLKVISGSRCK
ncbi:hypothetical protein F4678DRAFT_162670 [Xylaria arbuscula]|nr:hypothetical protein F4678DRAFT_162670 [Xylaria arbuscula]